MARRIRGQLLDGWLGIVDEPVVGLDRSGSIQFATQRFREHYPQAGEGEVFWECLPSDPLVRWVSDNLDSTTPDVREQIMSHRPEVLWLARLDPVLGDAGRCSGWILRLKDIQPIERLSQRLDTLMGEVKRRLRESLAVMKSRLELLLEGGLADQDLTVELLGQINEESNQLTRLLFSLESDEEGVESTPEMGGTSVEAILQKVFDTFEPLARAKNLALRLNAATDLAPLNSVAEGELERCLVNLVDNAVKYTSLNGYGEVTLTARSHHLDGKNGILLSVDDSGPGVPSEFRESVFEQFYRLNEGPTARLGGTGLGLWRVAEVAGKRGGSAWIEDSSQGGAGLRLFLPFDEAVV